MTGTTSYYLFTREQLLTALEAHVAGMPDDEANSIRIKTLAFLDGAAAQANGLIVTPKIFKDA